MAPICLVALQNDAHAQELLRITILINVHTETRIDGQSKDQSTDAHFGVAVTLAGFAGKALAELAEVVDEKGQRVH